MEDHTLTEERVIGSLTHGDVYRYLGVEQLFKPSLRTIKERVKRTSLSRLKQVLGLKVECMAQGASHKRLGSISVEVLFLPEMDMEGTEAT